MRKGLLATLLLLLAVACLCALRALVTARSRTPLPSRIETSPSRPLPPTKMTATNPPVATKVDPKDPPPAPHSVYLSPEEVRQLDEEIAEAGRTPVDRLIDSLFAAIDQGQGRERALRCWRLTWALQKDASGLREVDLRAHAASSDKLRALLYVLGRAGTRPCRELLLRWIEDSSLASYELEVLTALHLEARTSRDEWELCYCFYLRQPESTWRDQSPPSALLTPDSDVVEATLARLASPSKEVRHLAGEILSRVSGTLPGEKVDPSLRDRITLAFVGLLDPGRDPVQRLHAIDYLGCVRDLQVSQRLWAEFDSGGQPAEERAALARAVARQAVDAESLHRVFAAISRESDPAQRELLLWHIPTYDLKTPALKEAYSREVSAWAPFEPNEELRARAAREVVELFRHEKAPLDWALNDVSERVRAEALRALNAR